MKKSFSLLLVVMLTLVFNACGGNKSNQNPDNIVNESISDNQNSSKILEMNNHTLDGILQDITNDFDSTISYLIEEYETISETIGESYDSYVKNEQMLTDWYELAQTKSEELFARTADKSVLYYKTVTSTVDIEDYDAVEDAMDNFYERIYEDAFDDYYDTIYEDLYDTVYDAYYDGIIDDAYDTVDYSEWLDVRSDCYSNWLDSRSDIYSLWLDERSDIYGDWLDVKGEFWSDNFDVDSILNTSSLVTDDVEQKQQENNTSSTDGIRPEFRESMDSYESFFDEYVDFMKKYLNSDDALSMMSEYTEFMKKYTETMTALEEIDEDELSTEEALYYTKVTSRISKKLLEVAG